MARVQCTGSVSGEERSRGRGVSLPWIAALGGILALAALLHALGLVRLVPNGTGGAGGDGERERVAAAVVPVDPTRTWNLEDDPSRDGWETEAFSVAAGKQLKRLGALLGAGPPYDPDELAELFDGEFACGPLRPAERESAFAGGAVRVERAAPGEAPEVHRGPAGPARALGDLLAPYGADPKPRVEFKLFGIRAGEDGTLTDQYVTVFGRTGAGTLEQNATWTIRWSEAAGKQAPRIRHVAVTAHEEVAAPGPLFADCTEAVLGATPAYAPQILRGFGEFLGRSQVNRGMVLMGAPGLAVGDADGDGLEDLYLCQEGGLPNRLFLQQRDGTAREVSAEVGVDWLDCTRSALLVDLDNDGDQDLVAATPGALVTAANGGGGRFAIEAVLAIAEDPMSLTAADPDADGDLDLYVCAYDANRLTPSSSPLEDRGAEVGFVYHDSNTGGANSFYRNERAPGAAPGAGWHFSDATFALGLDRNNRRYSLAAAWEDLDNDGDQDLYVANDFGRNNYYRNGLAESGRARFTDVAAEAEAEDSASGMSISFGDYDRDGWMDVYVGNMYSAAGNRITTQDAFKIDVPEVRDRLQRFARGNTLMRNQGGGSFADVSLAAAVNMGRWAWSSRFLDLNNDGWEDLVVANGYITTEDTHDL